MGGCLPNDVIDPRRAKRDGGFQLEALRRIFGVAHLVLAVAVGIHLLVGPLYESTQVWKVLDWFIAIGVIAAVASAYIRWTGTKSLDHGERIGSGAMLIGAVALLLWFFEQWFTTRLFTENGDAALISDRINLWWQFVTMLFVIVSGEVGMWLLGIGHHGGDRSRQLAS